MGASIRFLLALLDTSEFAPREAVVPKLVFLILAPSSPSSSSELDSSKSQALFFDCFERGDFLTPIGCLLLSSAPPRGGTLDFGASSTSSSSDEASGGASTDAGSRSGEFDTWGTVCNSRGVAAFLCSPFLRGVMPLNGLSIDIVQV